MTLSEHRVVVLNSLSVSDRLDEIRNMKDGWLDGDGAAPCHAGLDWLASCFERHFPRHLPLPYIFPTPEGGVEAEWSIGRHSVIFEIDLESRQGDWLRFDKQSDEEDSHLLDLADNSRWEWLTSEIRRLVELSE